MSLIQYDHHVDWLTLTVRGGYDAPQIRGNAPRAREIAASVFHMFALPVVAEHLFAGRPEFGYAYAFTDPTSAITVNVGSDLEKQGLMLVATGTSLTARVDGRLLLLQGLEQGWKPTRIDVAFDIHDSGVTVRQMHEEYTADDRGRMIRSVGLKESRTGATFTVGARSSEKYLRIYDKAGEQGVRGDWVRVEIELKGDAAIEYAGDIATDDSSASVLIAPLLSGCANDLARTMQQIAGGHEPARPITRAESNPNKLLWLRKSVIPTLVKLFYNDRVTFNKFLDDLHTAIDEENQARHW